MTIRSGFFNSDAVTHDRKYNADYMSSYFTGLMTRGVVKNYNGELIVKATTGMGVQISPGRAFFTDGKFIENDAPINLTIDNSDVLLNRIDRIVLREDKNDAFRTATIVLKKGTPATTPVAPDLVSDKYVEEMSLATIYIGKQVSEIYQSKITDTRPDKNQCGFITGLIEQLDLTEAYLQYQDGVNRVVIEGEQRVDDMIEQGTSEFQQWFASIKEFLATSTLIRAYDSLYTTKVQDETLIPINLPMYNKELDILQVYINGLKLSAVNEYSVTSKEHITLTKSVDAGTPIAFVVYKSIDGSKAETVVGTVEELKIKMDELSRYTYFATGEDDFMKLKEHVTNLIRDDYNDHITVNVVGHNFVCGDMKETIGDRDYSFVLDNDTDKTIVIDFSNCNNIIVEGSFAFMNNVTIKNLHLKCYQSNTAVVASIVKGDNVVVDGCNFSSDCTGASHFGLNINNSEIMNTVLDVLSNGNTNAIRGKNLRIINTEVKAKSTANTCYGIYAEASTITDSLFESTSLSVDSIHSGIGAFCCGSFTNCKFIGIGNFTGKGFAVATAALVTMANCVCRGYAKNNGKGTGFYGASDTEATYILHGINCNQVTLEGYVQTESMEIPGGYGALSGIYWKTPVIYDETKVQSYGKFVRNRQ